MAGNLSQTRGASFFLLATRARAVDDGIKWWPDWHIIVPHRANKSTAACNKNRRYWRGGGGVKPRPGGVVNVMSPMLAVRARLIAPISSGMNGDVIEMAAISTLMLREIVNNSIAENRADKCAVVWLAIGIKRRLAAS